jgi:hypothetical protein
MGTKQEDKQLNVFEEIKREEEAKKPYRNAMGELLPWEEEEYEKNKKNNSLA